MKRRTYRPDCRWAVWRWTEVSCDGAPYLTRLHLLKTPWFAVFLHWFHAPDPQPDPHDHPVSFLSIPLRGGYVEERGVYRVHPTHTQVPSTRWVGGRFGKWWNYVRSTDVHRVLKLHGQPITLVFSGPKVREWGHWTVDGWVHWREYKAERKPQ